MHKYKCSTKAEALNRSHAVVAMEKYKLFSAATAHPHFQMRWQETQAKTVKFTKKPVRQEIRNWTLFRCGVFSVGMKETQTDVLKSRPAKLLIGCANVERFECAQKLNVFKYSFKPQYWLSLCVTWHVRWKVFTQTIYFWCKASQERLYRDRRRQNIRGLLLFVTFQRE